MFILHSHRHLCYTAFMSLILSWNVNGIRAIEKKDFIPWLEKTNPHVLCLQETKANSSQLSEGLLSPEGYKTYWASAQKAGYSGTAIFTKKEPDLVETMGIPDFDNEGRTLIAHFGNIAIISAYFPNSQDGGARLDYKLSFCKAMLDLCNNLVSKGKHIVLCGDYNIAHKPIDLANPKNNEKNPGYLPEEREWMDVFTSSGYVDTFRHFCPEPAQYSWWSYRFHAREKNIGWRIDYQCVNQDFLPEVKNAWIMSSVFGSDHCPVAMETKQEL